MAQQYSQTSTGFYGKVPWAGDFVQRRLPEDLVTHWDRHLCEVLPSLPPITTSLSGPWAFLSAPNTCGSAAFAGVVAPGADRVGRRFPLLLARLVDADGDAGGLLRGSLPWFDAAWRLHAALANGSLSGTDAFEQRVLELDGYVAGDVDTQAAPQGLLDGWLRCLERGGSLWWCNAATICTLDGLPNAQDCLQVLRVDRTTEVHA